MDWAHDHVFSSMYVCWGAFAGLYHNHGIAKHPLDKKLSGVFRHRTLIPSHPLLRGFQRVFQRAAFALFLCDARGFADHDSLLILAESLDAGVYIAATADGREVYITGHPEYDADTLKLEYIRDSGKKRLLRGSGKLFSG